MLSFSSFSSFIFFSKQLVWPVVFLEITHFHICVFVDCVRIAHWLSQLSHCERPTQQASLEYCLTHKSLFRSVVPAGIVTVIDAKYGLQVGKDVLRVLFFSFSRWSGQYLTWVSWLKKLHYCILFHCIFWLLHSFESLKSKYRVSGFNFKLTTEMDNS